MNNWKHVYVFLSENGNIKIGVSKNVEKRISAIKGASGYKIVDCFITEKCSNAFEIESMAHEYFKKNRLFGEWFNADFNKAVKVVKDLHDEFSNFFTTEEKKQDISSIKLIFGNMPFDEKYEFSDEFIEMAIELGEKMKEIKRLKEEIKRKEISNE